MEPTIDRRSFVSLAALPLVAPGLCKSPKPTQTALERTVFRYRPAEGYYSKRMGVDSPFDDKIRWILPLFLPSEFDDPEAQPVAFGYAGELNKVPINDNSVGSCEVECHRVDGHWFSIGKVKVRTVYKPALCESLVTPDWYGIIRSIATGWVAHDIAAHNWNMADSIFPRLEDGYVRAASSFNLTPCHVEIKTIDYEPLTNRLFGGQFKKKS